VREGGRKGREGYSEKGRGEKVISFSLLPALLVKEGPKKVFILSLKVRGPLSSLTLLPLQLRKGGKETMKKKE